ncbi:hypothetical protein [Gemmobacter denitrificans]|uniref:Minor tail protein n=1 Tax=Gemmobacter denitrificans TaxID=3123040 RepID=A0ABU8BQY0_9RHOB
MPNVYAWPPVGILSLGLTEDAPTDVQRSLITGKRYVSASRRKRRVVKLTASALARGRSGAGYMENLKTLLDGGVHLVRLDIGYINWWLDRRPQELVGGQYRNALYSDPVTWTTETDPSLSWTNGGDAVTWFTGRVLQGTAGTAGGWNVLTVTNAPPSRLIARPGDFVTLYSPISATTGNRARVMTEAYSDASGNATIRLMTALSGSGRVNIGTADEGVFEVVEFPDVQQPVAGDWVFPWAFREVFEDETDTWTEVNPW